ncbi:MAG: hypothetical protein HY558_02320 [Euryarchaeota archaeon]|nr:hypothetical protein [Euryarchaeota archaeon]
MVFLRGPRPRRKTTNPALEEALASLRETRGQVSEETYREMETALRRK